jgi:hypothetical protein
LLATRKSLFPLFLASLLNLELLVPLPSYIQESFIAILLIKSLFVYNKTFLMDNLDKTLQDNIQAGEEQLQGNLYSAYLEKDIDFEQREEILLETQKLSLAPCTLKGYTILVAKNSWLFLLITNISSLYKQFVDYIIKQFS